ncbi:isoprenoid synthase domain-containing protein, partial [Phaeosphaeria sp. MPI-PUGE-AT-0046c]
IDTLDTYLELRVRNVGSTHCLTIMPWAYDLNVPSWVWEHEAIIREIALSVSLGIDLASRQKELKMNEVDSIIPILVLHQTISAQQAADKAISMMAQSWEDILDAKSCLRHAVRMEEDLIQRHVDILLDGFMDVLIGHVVYIWHTRRYLSKDVFDGNSHGFTVVL